jgi:hypothetical protein
VEFENGKRWKIKPPNIGKEPKFAVARQQKLSHISRRQPPTII